MPTTAGPSWVAWAKLGGHTWPDNYHPVLCHLLDVAAVARRLWELALRPRVRDRVVTQLGIPPSDAASLVAFWVGAHDLGKLSPGFQDRGTAKTASLRARFEADGYQFHRYERHHGEVSTATLPGLLAGAGPWPRLDRGFAEQLSVAVGGHHGVYYTGWKKYEELLDASAADTRWRSARGEVLAELARVTGADRAPVPRPTAEAGAALTALAGLTAVADWVGSDPESFPPVGSPQVATAGLDAAEYYRRALDRADAALDRLGWLRRADYDPGPVPFAGLFAAVLAGRPPRPLQDAVARAAAAATGPAIYVVEAPMGEGKTEAAWYVADCWVRAGGQGVYVALPT
ncbi:MAG TPA: CRISPR-associated endonuclease Cas3'', partial [Fimbriiglobus sp.]|nr:CRISPR-associated endonuclease Cas3'' [Fimbriiglobus sp.]